MHCILTMTAYITLRIRNYCLNYCLIKQVASRWVVGQVVEQVGDDAILLWLLAADRRRKMYETIQHFGKKLIINNLYRFTSLWSRDAAAVVSTIKNSTNHKHLRVQIWFCSDFCPGTRNCSVRNSGKNQHRSGLENLLFYFIAILAGRILQRWRRPVEENNIIL